MNETLAQDCLATVVELSGQLDDEPLYIGPYVQAMTEKGHTRDRAVAEIQRLIAAGGIILTSRFELALPETSE